jgi:outer membrane autotransporter protein
MLVLVRCARLGLVAMVLSGVNLFASLDAAHAATSCSGVAPVQSSQLTYPGVAVLSADSPSIALDSCAGVSAFPSPANNALLVSGGTNSSGHGGTCISPGTSSGQCIFVEHIAEASGTTGSESVTSTCASLAQGTVSAGGINTTSFVLQATETCTVTIAWTLDGGTTVYTLTGTATNSAGVTAFTPISVSGGGHGAATTATTGPTAQQRTQRVISNFMSRRADQITANDPDLVDRLNGGAGGGSGPVAFSGSGNSSQTNVAFSTSLRRMARAGDASKTKAHKDLPGMMSLGQGRRGAQSNGISSGFDVWMKGTWAHADDATRESDIGLLYIGADYRMSPDMVFGLLAQFDWVEDKDATQNTDVDGTGWLAGPYIVARLHQNLIFDARAAWGRSDNDISPLGTYTDSFDTDRWLLRGKLTGDFKEGAWSFAPHVAVIYFEEEQDAYTDSLGNLISSQTVSLGRLTFGPKVSYRWKNANGTTVAPYVALKGIWDFEEAETVDIATGLALGSDEVRARIEGGLAIQMPGGISLSGEGFYDGIGASDFDAYGGSAKIRVPLN